MRLTDYVCSLHFRFQLGITGYVLEKAKCMSYGSEPQLYQVQLRYSFNVELRLRNARHRFLRLQNYITVNEHPKNFTLQDQPPAHTCFNDKMCSMEIKNKVWFRKTGSESANSIFTRACVLNKITKINEDTLNIENNKSLHARLRFGFAKKKPMFSTPMLCCLT